MGENFEAKLDDFLKELNAVSNSLGKYNNVLSCNPDYKDNMSVEEKLEYLEVTRVAFVESTEAAPSKYDYKSKKFISRFRK